MASGYDNQTAAFRSLAQASAVVEETIRLPRHGKVTCSEFQRISAQLTLRTRRVLRPVLCQQRHQVSSQMPAGSGLAVRLIIAER